MIIADSNVWIFAEVQNVPEHHLAVEKLQKLLLSGLGINVIILSEVFHVLSSIFGTATTSERLTKIIDHPSVGWLGMDKATSKNAMRLSQRCKIRINDALIAQQALELNAQLLTDNVKHFQKVKGLKFIALRGTHK